MEKLPQFVVPFKPSTGADLWHSRSLNRNGDAALRVVTGVVTAPWDSPPKINTYAQAMSGMASTPCNTYEHSAQKEEARKLNVCGLLVGGE
jgi:hypothetical protein